MSDKNQETAAWKQQFRDAAKMIPHGNAMCSAHLLTLDDAIAHAEACADDTPCGQNHKQLADWLRKFKRLLLEREKSQAKEKGIKYEYAVQEKFKGSWIITDQGLPNHEEAKGIIRWLCKRYPTLTEAEFRVVRRPTDWEVVE